MITNEVLQIGGGNIGRALIGDVMHDAGMHVTFADIDHKLINAINDERGYELRTVSVDGSEQKYIDNIDGVHMRDEEAMVKKIVDADIITTAVGAAALSHVAPLLAKGLAERARLRERDEMHVVVVACENIEQNSQTLRNYIFDALPESIRDDIAETVSFPNCAVDRIVPATNRDNLTVTAEDYFQLTIDQNALLSDLSNVPGIKIVDDLEAVLAQKLYTLNGAHAALAYWGHIKGVLTIDEAMRDNSINELLNGLFDDISSILVRQFPSITTDAQAAFVDTIKRRFLNPYLQDNVDRVGRDPKRKLARTDRLMAPMLFAHERHEYSPYLSAAVASGYRFNALGDKQSVVIQDSISQNGFNATAVALTGLDRMHPLIRSIQAQYQLSLLS